MKPEGAPAVLLVDDNLEYAQALAKALERAGYDVCVAGGSQDALRLFLNQPFDLVITDLQMPGVSGLDLLRQIRAARPDIPVVLITAFGEWTTYLQAMNIGAVDYLNKPVRRQDILFTIRKALGRRGIGAPDILPESEEAGQAMT